MENGFDSKCISYLPIAIYKEHSIYETFILFLIVISFHREEKNGERKTNPFAKANKKDDRNWTKQKQQQKNILKTNHEREKTLKHSSIKKKKIKKNGKWN